MYQHSVSIILPTYNESGNIVELVRAIKTNIPCNWEYEIIVVDDNSPDNTLGVVTENFSGDSHVKSILRLEDRGFAKSIRAGIQYATGEWVVVMDSDLTHDPVELPKLLHVGQIYDLVSGSRFCAGGRMRDSAHYFFSMGYNWVLRLLIHTQVQDNLGGYFAARREMILSLPLDEIFFGYGEYYFRLLHFVQKTGHTVVELPASYLLRGQGKSKSNWPRMLLTYTIGAIKLNRRIRKIHAQR
jgi:dolichol-phosphate mannosyltransferase